MHTISAPWSSIGAVLALIAVSVTLWFIIERRRQSHGLQRRFGSEYGRTVRTLGSQARAESDLLAREQRVRRLSLNPLADLEAARFSQAWNVLQACFIDSPGSVVGRADQLVRELMLKRGYPTGDFEHRMNDLSVDHPTLVAPYRLAQGVMARAESGVVDTEGLRQALIHYREVFDELLEVNAVKQVALIDAAMPAHP